MTKNTNTVEYLAAKVDYLEKYLSIADQVNCNTISAGKGSALLAELNTLYMNRNFTKKLGGWGLTSCGEYTESDLDEESALKLGISKEEFLAYQNEDVADTDDEKEAGVIYITQDRYDEIANLTCDFDCWVPSVC